MLKTERKLVNLGQGAKNMFHLGFKSICVELASAYLKMKKAQNCWNNWRKVGFLLVLAISLCLTTFVIERKQLAASSRGLSPQLQTDSHGLFCKCVPVTLGAHPSKQICSVVSVRIVSGWRWKGLQGAVAWTSTEVENQLAAISDSYYQNWQGWI